MTEMLPQPWHAEATRLRADGLTGEAIGRRVGVSGTQVRRLLNPFYGEKQREQTRELNKARRRDRAYQAERAAYSRMRRQARREAEARV